MKNSKTPLLKRTTKSIPGFAAILLASLFVYAGSASAATFHMSETGTRTVSEGASVITGDNALDWADENCYPNLNLAFQAMHADTSSVHELVIDDGVYIGNANKISSGMGQAPPDGTPQQYTIMRARNEGGVTFGTTGAGADWMFLYFGSHGSGPMEYVEFRGIKWRNSGNNGENAVFLGGSNYVKFIRCGFVDSGYETRGNASAFGVDESSYVLVEECYAWGDGRYKFIIHESNHIIVRRCVARYDFVYSEAMPKSGFNAYASQHVLFQNNIAIDGDTRGLWSDVFIYDHERLYKGGIYCIPGTIIDNDPDPANENGCMMRPTQIGGAFYAVEGSSHLDPQHVTFRGNIALNWDMQFLSTGQEDSDVGPIDVIDNVGWDIWDGGSGRGNLTTIENGTFGNFKCAACGSGISEASNGRSFNGYGPNNNVMRNSILYNIDTTLNDLISTTGTSAYETLENNSFYECDLYSLGDIQDGNFDDIDPLDGSIEYLPRIESGSVLEAAGVGANIMKRIGVSGTLWGEPGYNDVTDEDLWPFPYEDQIKRDMSTYSRESTVLADDGQSEITATINGARGFAASTPNPRTPTGEVTLTSYIWEYLGNEIPCEIYNTCSALAGDIDGSGAVDLGDAISALKVLSGIDPSGIRSDYPSSGADVNLDSRAGMAEVLFILQTVAGLR